jgi:hypothetical protein
VSYDLWVYAGPAYDARTAQQAMEICSETGAEDAFQKSPKLPNLLSAILAVYPALESLSEADVLADASPWSVTPAASDRVLAFSFAFSRVEEVATLIVKEAFDRGLFTFDPQDGSIYPPKGMQDDQVVHSIVRTP